VFATRKGTPLSADNVWKRKLKVACQVARLKPIAWHTLRHTHSTLLYVLGIPRKVAQAQLGHSRMATTLEIYTHAPIDAQRKAVAKLERILFPSLWWEKTRRMRNLNAYNEIIGGADGTRTRDLLRDR